MSEVAVELKLASEQYEQLIVLARARQRSVSEVMQTAVTEWLARQAQMERARCLMRELGQGLANGAAGQPIAREHDAYFIPGSAAAISSSPDHFLHPGSPCLRIS